MHHAEVLDDCAVVRQSNSAGPNPQISQTTAMHLGRPRRYLLQDQTLLKQRQTALVLNGKPQMIVAQIRRHDERTSFVLAELVDDNNGGNAEPGDPGNLAAKALGERITRLGEQ